MDGFFFWKFDDEWDNPVNNQNIYSVEGNNRLSPGLQPLKIGSALKIIFNNPAP